MKADRAAWWIEFADYRTPDKMKELAEILTANDKRNIIYPEVLSIADDAWIIAEQHIVAHGSPQALLNNAEPRVRQFLDGIADGPVPFRYPAGDYEQDLLAGRER